jgi:putative ABC transport system permease protein
MMVQIAGIIIGFIPAFRAYRQSLADGMTIRI